MDERYELIEGYLQECVNEDIYTEEFANQILELAYDKYIVEKSDSNNSSDLKERIKKNKKKIIALIALCTATIVIAKKMLKDDKIKKEQKNHIEMYLDMIVELNEKNTKLKAEALALDYEVKMVKKENNKMKEKIKDQDKSLEWHRGNEEDATTLYNKMALNDTRRRNLARRKDQLIKNPDNKELMTKIIKLEKKIGKSEKEIKNLRDKLYGRGYLAYYAPAGMEKHIKDMNDYDDFGPADKTKLD